MYCLCTRCIIVNSVQVRSEFGKFAYTAICMHKCTLWSDNTCIFTRFRSIKNANTQLIWSSNSIYCSNLAYPATWSEQPPVWAITLNRWTQNRNTTYADGNPNSDLVLAQKWGGIKQIKSHTLALKWMTTWKIQ